MLWSVFPHLIYFSQQSFEAPFVYSLYNKRETDVMRWRFSTGRGLGSRARRTQAGTLLMTGTCSDRWNEVAQLGDYFKGHHSWPRSA